jgi:hypothetical protein
MTTTTMTTNTTTSGLDARRGPVVRSASAISGPRETTAASVGEPPVPVGLKLFVALVVFFFALVAVSFSMGAQIAL